MRILAIAILLSLASNFAFAECTDSMQAFNKHQLVIKGMMDLNFKGQMNAQVGDAIGKRLKEAQVPLDAGEYEKACVMYDSILADYGFDTSLGTESTTATETKPEQETAASAEASSAASSSSGAASSAAGSQ